MLPDEGISTLLPSSQGLNNAVALDFDYREQMIYWTDVTTQGSMIRRMHINGSNVQVGDCSCPSGIPGPGSWSSPTSCTERVLGGIQAGTRTTGEEGTSPALGSSLGSHHQPRLLQ